MEEKNTYKYHIDELVEMWRRNHYEVEAYSQEEADGLMLELCRTKEIPFGVEFLETEDLEINKEDISVELYSLNRPEALYVRHKDVEYH